MVPFNDIEFKPDGKVLKYWTLLPQVSTTIGSVEIPPLFGALKFIPLYYIFVIFLISLEITAAFFLVDQGAPITILAVLSILDFIIAMIPALWETRPKYGLKQIKANIFIAESKLQLPIKDSSTYGGKYNTKDDLAQSKKQIKILFLVKFSFSLLIIVFGVAKFWSYFGIYDMDIFTDPSGRFLLGTILLSVFVHIFCTKTFIYHIIFQSAFNKQINEYRRGEHKTPQKYEAVEIEYQVPYVKVSAITNFKLLQEKKEGDSTSVRNRDCIILHTTSGDMTFSLYNIEGFDLVFLITRGIIQESHIRDLYAAQGNPGAVRAVIAKCKERQLSQIIGQ